MCTLCRYLLGWFIGFPLGLFGVLANPPQGVWWVSADGQLPVFGGQNGVKTVSKFPSTKEFVVIFLDEVAPSLHLCSIWNVSGTNIRKTVQVSMDVFQDYLFGKKVCIYWGGWNVQGC